MIKISDKIKSLDKAISLGILTADVKVEKSCTEIVALLNQEVESVETLTLENYRNETLEASRAIYKALGKDPSRYRISSDSLYRRIIKKKGIYYVNNVVDINNIISMRTLWSVGAYDIEKIDGEIVYGVGSDEIYEGIGRGTLNIDKLPVLIDERGPFGSATSDSIRTMVTEDTRKILMVIHAFGDGVGLESSLDDMKKYLELYASGENINISVLRASLT